MTYFTRFSLSSRRLIRSVWIVIVVFLLLPNARAGTVNYLVLTGSASNNLAVGTTTLTAKISTTCPAGVGAAYAYYGSWYGQYSFNASGNPVTNKVICVVGVPATVTLSPVGEFGYAPIVLTVGGTAQSLTSYSNPIANTASSSSVGIYLPDNSAVIAATTYSPGIGIVPTAVGRYSPIGYQNTATFQYVDTLGAVCFSFPQGNGQGTLQNCANYVLGF